MFFVWLALFHQLDVFFVFSNSDDFYSSLQLTFFSMH